MSKASLFERQMLELINEERTSRGLDPLQLELRLNTSSEDHSEWMLNRDVFSHTGSNGSSAGDRMRDSDFKFSGNWTWGENIAWQSERGSTGISDDVANLHAGLMNSPGHRANILNPDFEVIGIGIERGDYKGYDAVMVTQNFAATDAPVRIDGGTTPPPPDPEPEDNMPPVAWLNRMTFSPNEWLDAGKLVKFRDADGDAPTQFMVRNTLDDFKIQIDGRTFEGPGTYRIDADDIESLRITADSVGDRGNMQIRAHDGTEWGNWDSFRLRAVAPTAPASQDDNDLIASQDAAAPFVAAETIASDQLRDFDLDACIVPHDQDVFLMA